MKFIKSNKISAEYIQRPEYKTLEIPEYREI